MGKEMEGRVAEKENRWRVGKEKLEIDGREGV